VSPATEPAVSPEEILSLYSAVNGNFSSFNGLQSVAAVMNRPKTPSLVQQNFFSEHKLTSLTGVFRKSFP
jgi:hypothetical protein